MTFFHPSINLSAYLSTHICRLQVDLVCLCQDFTEGDAYEYDLLFHSCHSFSTSLRRPTSKRHSQHGRTPSIMDLDEYPNWFTRASIWLALVARLRTSTFFCLDHYLGQSHIRLRWLCNGL